MAFATGTLGTETSGSILSPSDANGDVGVKTTRGLASRFGILPLSPSYDVPGPIVRDVTDAAILVGAIAGPDPHDPVTADATSHEPPGGDYTPFLRADALHGVTLTYSNDDYNGLDDEHKALFDEAIARIEKLGGTVVPSRTLGSTENFGLAEIGAIPNEFKQSFNQYLADEMPNAKVHSLADVIAFNNQHPDKFPHGQELLQGSDATPGSADLFAAQDAPAQTSAQQSIDGALAETGAQAILTPGNLQANIGAAAGYPTAMVPQRLHQRRQGPLGGRLPRPGLHRAQAARLRLCLRAGHARARGADRRQQGPRAGELPGRAGPCARPRARRRRRPAGLQAARALARPLAAASPSASTTPTAGASRSSCAAARASSPAARRASTTAPRASTCACAGQGATASPWSTQARRRALRCCGSASSAGADHEHAPARVERDHEAQPAMAPAEAHAQRRAGVAVDELVRAREHGQLARQPAVGARDARCSGAVRAAGAPIRAARAARPPPAA